MQRRQTIVIGSLLAGMALVAVLAMGMWSGVVPVLYEPGFSSATPKDPATPPVCPPSGAVSVELSSITANVYNGSETAGLAGDVAKTLSSAGVTVANTTNWPQGSYDGDILITASNAGLVNAYTMARAFTGNVTVQIDATADPTDTTISVVLGSEYTSSILSDDAMRVLAAGESLIAPNGCVASTKSPS